MASLHGANICCARFTERCTKRRPRCGWTADVKWGYEANPHRWPARLRPRDRRPLPPGPSHAACGQCLSESSLDDGEREVVMKQQYAQSGLAQGHRGLFYGWWIVIIGCIQDAVKGGTFN